ncbi:MAG: hypothetical protein CVV05_15490 [Gammaproteobacteria bacterium HGW-Gammaproteobacteria-1]|jgi:hypothetical protein|nr:MAG: hypothetical protein CVV05_15490 [Gammaproteobacteria bacterium HGW-Gammaproteobacteria-1]
MSGFSDYCAGALLDHLFGIAALAQPTLYIALSHTDPGADGSGLTEPTAPTYARVAHADWARSARQVVNNSDIAFPQAATDWGATNITHFAILDADVLGNVIASGPLPIPQKVAAGETPKFLAGYLKAELPWTAS